MHIEVLGEGPPLVLVHGWAMHGGIFAPLVEVLRSQHRIYLIDLPGHGQSRGQPLELHNTLAQLARILPRAAWLGWSLGGSLLTRLALDYPQSVSHLLCLASSPRFVQAADWPHAMTAEVFARFASELRSDWHAVVQRFLALEVLGSAEQKNELRWLREHIYQHGEPDLQALEQGLELLGSLDQRAELPQLACPSLWLGGSRDRLVPPEAIAAAARLSGGECVMLAGAGHAPFLTQPTLVAEHLRAFFARTQDKPWR